MGCCEIRYTKLGAGSFFSRWLLKVGDIRVLRMFMRKETAPMRIGCGLTNVSRKASLDFAGCRAIAPIADFFASRLGSAFDSKGLVQLQTEFG